MSSRHNITLRPCSSQEFGHIQSFIIEIIEAAAKNARILIITDPTNPSMLLNIKATLWYYDGYSYPHLNSEDALADESRIVVTQNIDYLFDKKFDTVITIYCHLLPIKIEQIHYQIPNLFIVDIEPAINNLSLHLSKNNIVFVQYGKTKLESQPTKKDIDFITSHVEEGEEQVLPKTESRISDNISNKQNKRPMNRSYPDRANQEQDNDKAIVIIKPIVLKKKMEFVMLLKLTDFGFFVVKFQRRKMSKEIWEEFYGHLRGKPFFNNYCEYMASEYVGLVNIMHKPNDKMDIYTKIRNAVGPTNPLECKSYQLRYQFGLDINDNGIHASDSHESFLRETEILQKFKIY